METMTEVDHPTFNGLWVLIGDRVVVHQFRGEPKPATVVGLRVDEDESCQVMVSYDRKPPARPRRQWVRLDHGGDWLGVEWITEHQSAG